MKENINNDNFNLSVLDEDWGYDESSDTLPLPEDWSEELVQDEVVLDQTGNSLKWKTTLD